LGVCHVSDSYLNGPECYLLRQSAESIEYRQA